MGSEGAREERGRRGTLGRAFHWQVAGSVVVGLATVGFLAASFLDAPLVSVLLIGLLLLCPLLMWAPFRSERGSRQSSSVGRSGTQR